MTTASPVESASSVPPPFDALPALAHVELDRFCGKCGYNLRGQSVKKDPMLHVLLCRCPECGSFTAANEAPLVHHGWVHRLRMVLVIAWVLTAAYLLCLSIFGQFAVMVSATEELVRMKEWQMDPSGRNQYWTSDRTQLRRMETAIASVAGSGAIGLVSLMLWTVMFPHWPRAAYRLLAVIVPALGAMAAAVIITYFSGRIIHDALPAWNLLAMAAAHMLLGLLGALIGRPAARFAVRVLLPPALRPAVGYLWMADGKEPPHAK